MRCSWRCRRTSLPRAQETVNYASVSGRVTDPQGAVVPGAVVTARQTETNVRRRGRHRRGRPLPVSVSEGGPVRDQVHLEGFAEATRIADADRWLGIRSALVARRWGVDTNVTVTAEATVLETARSQIAGTVTPDGGQEPAAERAQLSRSRAARARRFADQRRQHAALRRDVGGGRPGHLGRQPAQFLQQLHRGRSVGQRRCGRVERHTVRRGCRGSVPGGHVGRAGRAWDARSAATSTSSRRAAPTSRTATSTAISATIASTRRTRSPGTKLPMNQKQYGASLGGPIRRDRTFFFSNVEQRTLDQTGLVTICRNTVTTINARLSAVGYPGSRVTTGVYPNPVDYDQFPRQSRSSVEWQRPVQRSLQPVRRHVEQFARRRRDERAVGVLGARQHRSGGGVRQHVEPFVRGPSTRPGRSSATAIWKRPPPTDRTGGEHSGRRIVRNALGSPDRTRQQDVPGRRQPLASGGRACAAGGVDFLYNDSDITYPAVDSRRLHVLVARRIS